MDPTNNPTPTTPSPEPTAGPVPEPNLGTDQNAMPTDSTSVNPTTANSTPNTTADGMGSGGATAPNPPVGVAASPASNVPKVNPVVMPGGATPVNPVVRPNGIGITDPITVPEKPQAPDPVEEELKAPMKAAGPVPGSIGSAVSGPSEALGGAEAGSAENPFAGDEIKQTPSVSFNDPAVQAGNSIPNPAGATTPMSSDKKKTNKTTLIALIAVAAVIVVILIVFLIIQLTNGGGGGSSSSGGSTANNGQSNSQVAPPDDSDDNNSDNSTGGDSNNTDAGSDRNTVLVPAIICSTNYTDDSGDINSQTIDFMIEDNKLTEINASVKITDANGNEIGTSSQVMSIDKLMQDSGDGSEFVGNDGTLFVDEKVLSEEFEKVLNSNAGGAYEYDCVVN